MSGTRLNAVVSDSKLKKGPVSGTNIPRFFGEKTETTWRVVGWEKDKRGQRLSQASRAAGIRPSSQEMA